MKRRVPLITSKGEGTIEEIYLSDLDYLMVKVYYPETKTWTTYNLGKHDKGYNMFLEAINKARDL